MKRSSARERKVKRAMKSMGFYSVAVDFCSSCLPPTHAVVFPISEGILVIMLRG